MDWCTIPLPKVSWDVCLTWSACLPSCLCAFLDFKSGFVQSFPAFLEVVLDNLLHSSSSPSLGEKKWREFITQLWPNEDGLAHRAAHVFVCSGSEYMREQSMWMDLFGFGSFLCYLIAPQFTVWQEFSLGYSKAGHLDDFFLGQFLSIELWLFLLPFCHRQTSQRYVFFYYFVSDARQICLSPMGQQCVRGWKQLLRDS